MTVYESEDGATTICEWFAYCANPTTFAIDHPVLGVVPICTRCAARSEISLES